MVYYVRVGMAIAVGWSVRTTASSFVAAGIDNDPPSSLIPDGAALGDWRTWPDR